jgi:CIC family chloride channel protein
VVVGLAVGLATIVFALACDVVVHLALHWWVGYVPSVPRGEEVWPILSGGGPLAVGWLLVVPAVGGLVSGWLSHALAPEVSGHGTDAAIDAYHRGQGALRARVPFLKIVTSAVSIGTGGSGGREGPISQIGAGFGSLIGGLLRLGPVERRILLAAGMGAGVAAMFRAPLAGALFAAEVLYWSPEFESEVIIPAGIASVVAYTTFGACYGWEPLFEVAVTGLDNPLQLVSYGLLAVAMALLARAYVRNMYVAAAVFQRLEWPRYLKPAVGGALTGAVGVALYFASDREEPVLAVFSYGYGILQDALLDASAVSAKVLLAVALGKILTTSLSIGSGGSGGAFGPAMVIGGCGGGALGVVLHEWLPALVPNPTSFVLVGMAGFFAAAAKTPFAALVIVSEMTGDYGLLLPALWVCLLAFLLSGKESLYGSQVESRALSPAHRGPGTDGDWGEPAAGERREPDEAKA